MEFEVTTDLSVIRDQHIGANFEAVSAWLDEELAPYRGLVVSEDMISSAKTYRANLRKLRDRIDAYRKEVKTTVMVPYNEFEQKAKILTGKIDEAVANIDGQVKEHEQREKDAKIAELRQTYDAYENAEAKEYLPWERLYNPKWANKTYSADDANTEISGALMKVSRDIAAIRSMGGDVTPYLLDTYRQTLDMSAVIQKNNTLLAMREAEDRRKREAEERRREEEERRKAEQNQQEVAEPQKPAPQTYAPAVTTELETDELVTVAFRVTCTKAQLMALGKYMKANGIKYGKA